MGVKVLNIGLNSLVAAKPQETNETLLQASRRLDWRFLLPDPHLGRVAYIGPMRGSLPEALRLFSQSLAVMGQPQPYGRSPAQYDTGVVHGPSGQTLRQAAHLVKSGGYLYVETYGLLRSGQLWRGIIPPANLNKWRLHFPNGCVRAVRQLGFKEVQVYWHWPNFEACTKIIPLDDEGALRYALAPGEGDVATQVKSFFALWLLRSGLLVRFVPCFSVVAQQGDRR